MTGKGQPQQRTTEDTAAQGLSGLRGHQGPAPALRLPHRMGLQMRHRPEGTEAASPQDRISNEAGMRKDWLWAPEESPGATSPTQHKDQKGQVGASPTRRLPHAPCSLL